MRVAFREFEGGIDFRSPRKFCCTIRIGRGFGKSFCLSSQIFVRILPDLYADPGTGSPVCKSVIQTKVLKCPIFT